MSSRSRAKAREAKYAGPIVDGVQYAPGYTQEAAEYEERTKKASPCPKCGALGWVFPCSECGYDELEAEGRALAQGGLI